MTERVSDLCGENLCVKRNGRRLPTGICTWNPFIFYVKRKKNPKEHVPREIENKARLDGFKGEGKGSVPFFPPLHSFLILYEPLTYTTRRRHPVVYRRLHVFLLSVLNLCMCREWLYHPIFPSLQYVAPHGGYKTADVGGVGSATGGPRPWTLPRPEVEERERERERRRGTGKTKRTPGTIPGCFPSGANTTSIPNQI